MVKNEAKQGFSQNYPVYQTQTTVWQAYTISNWPYIFSKMLQMADDH